MHQRGSRGEAKRGFSDDIKGDVPSPKEVEGDQVNRDEPTHPLPLFALIARMARSLRARLTHQTRMVQQCRISSR